jgi:hypothetical protein
MVQRCVSSSLLWVEKTCAWGRATPKHSHLQCQPDHNHDSCFAKRSFASRFGNKQYLMCIVIGHYWNFQL